MSSCKYPTDRVAYSIDDECDAYETNVKGEYVFWNGDHWVPIEQCQGRGRGPNRQSRFSFSRSPQAYSGADAVQECDEWERYVNGHWDESWSVPYGVFQESEPLRRLRLFANANDIPTRATPSVGILEPGAVASAVPAGGQHRLLCTRDLCREVRKHVTREQKNLILDDLETQHQVCLVANDVRSAQCVADQANCMAPQKKHWYSSRTAPDEKQRQTCRKRRKRCQDEVGARSFAADHLDQELESLRRCVADDNTVMSPQCAPAKTRDRLSEMCGWAAQAKGDWDPYTAGKAEDGIPLQANEDLVLLYDADKDYFYGMNSSGGFGLIPKTLVGFKV
jgi:hypothetical protein